MKFNIEVCGIRRYHGDDGRENFRKLAFAEIRFQDFGFTISGVLLTWSKKLGFRAFAPLPAMRDKPCVHWERNSDFALDLAERIGGIYEMMFGKVDEAPSEPAANDDTAGLRRFVGEAA